MRIELEWSGFRRDLLDFGVRALCMFLRAHIVGLMDRSRHVSTDSMFQARSFKPRTGDLGDQIGAASKPRISKAFGYGTPCHDCVTSDVFASYICAAYHRINYNAMALPNGAINGI